MLYIYAQRDELYQPRMYHIWNHRCEINPLTEHSTGEKCTRRKQKISPKQRQTPITLQKVLQSRNKNKERKTRCKNFNRTIGGKKTRHTEDTYVAIQCISHRPRSQKIRVRFMTSCPYYRVYSVCISQYAERDNIKAYRCYMKSNRSL